jgi:hypothetical protein
MLKPNDKVALLKFMKEWCKPMQDIFNQRFGRNKIGHILIALDTGAEPTVSYVTNLRDADFKRCLQMLSQTVNDRRIITQ